MFNIGGTTTPGPDLDLPPFTGFNDDTNSATPLLVLAIGIILFLMMSVALRMRRHRP